MSSNYTLNFLNEKDFEIICLDNGHAVALKNQLSANYFLQNVQLYNELGKKYPNKIIGETSNQDALVESVDKWEKKLASQEVEPFTDIDKE